MGQRYSSLSERHMAFINKQPLFFVATAGSENCRVNMSPKGMGLLKILSPNELVWLNVTGSGNETAAHVEVNERMTLMWCAFEGKPLILRAYGQAQALYPNDADWGERSAHFEPLPPGTRQCFKISVDLVQTSCGMAVPLMEFQQDRTLLNQWAQSKGEQGISDYWSEKNTVSLDGHDIESMQRSMIGDH